MLKHARIFIVMLGALLLVFAGCSKKTATKDSGKNADSKAAAAADPEKDPEAFINELYRLDDLRAALEENGFDPDLLMEYDGDLFYAYEAANAMEYDDQFQAEVGLLLGLMGGYTHGTATVAVAQNGEPVIRFTAKRDDIIAFAAGDIDRPEFMLRMDIEILAPGE
jgi:hypothetical protein